MADLSFLNMEVALEYCAGDEEILKEVLEEYLSEDKRPVLNEYYDAEDWHNYRIHVHAVKSSSLTIGATALSEEAKALELAAADEDGAMVKAGHDKLIADYTDLLDKISNALM